MQTDTDQWTRLVSMRPSTEDRIERIASLVDVLGTDRTDILVTPLRKYLQDATQNDALTQEIAAASSDEEITFEHLKALVGAEEAANRGVVKQQLDEDVIDEIADTELSTLMADTPAMKE